ncbi:MAG: 23S rRNA (guanosine(2251)-2'-O)-methyltransferase RlmB [Flavobacteriales bacterium]
MHRRPSERTFLFGIHPVLEALEERKPLQRVLFLKGKQTDELSTILRECRALDIPAQAVPKERLDRITRKNHQGVVAFTSPIEFQPLDEVVLGAFERGETPLVVALDGVTDVRNLGAIARTAECFGATALLVPTTGSAPINEEAVKSSAGALLRIPMCRAKNMASAVSSVTNLGLQVVAVSEKGTSKLSALNNDTPTCLVLGDEHQGVSNDVLKHCTSSISIPMQGKTSSLNVGVAAGIVLYAYRS